MAQLPPAGWHPDPMGRHAQRYWDGQQWTDHVADVAGNMTTDPLSGSSGQGQTQQAAEQRPAEQQPAEQQQAGQQAAAGRAATQQATDQAPQQQGAQQPTASSESASSTSTASQDATTQQQAVADEPASSTAADTGDRTETPTWGATSGTDTADTDEMGAETGQAAAGTSAATWGATSTTDTAQASADDSTPDSPSTADATTAGGDLDTTAGTVISSAGLVAIAVDEEGVLTNRTAVVARQDSVATSDEEAGHRLHGNGTAWLGGGGRHVAVIEVTGAGLVVGNDHLVAHSAGLTSEDAHSGIAGFEATRLSGTGWVAIAAAGGVAEVSTVGGVSVAEGALVGHTADLDVAHGDDVQLGGHGVALVSPGA